ncbi:MAG: hypothetical protein LBK65_01240 [Tannerellaceae bacterium]|jgi:hypothetical protein|nr:hypothetical protein [Tannerellaceae bacterium]
MGFFNFIRNDVQKPGEQQNANTQPETPSSPPPSIEEPATIAAQLPSQGLKKKQKDDISDFFNVNILNIFVHEPEFIEKYCAGDGLSVEKYILKLQKRELSSFNQITILRYENGNYDLLFTGDAVEVNTEMENFVNYCVRSLGEDFMRKNDFSEKDVRDIRLGIFSRIWYGRVRIENIYFTLSLTLHDIHPQVS